MAEKITSEHFATLFIRSYPERSEFYEDQLYNTFFEMCCETAADETSMAIMRFCNDTYGMPPVRLFFDLNRARIEGFLTWGEGRSMLEEDKVGVMVLDVALRRHIGAFWGTVFRRHLGYPYSSTTSVRRRNYYGIALLSRYSFEPPESKKASK